MSTLEDKVKFVVEKCGCTESDAEGALRKAGLDTDAAIKAIRESYQANAGRYGKSVRNVLRQSAHVRLSRDEREDIATRAELAEQGWEEVGAKSKVKKQAIEIRKSKLRTSQNKRQSQSRNEKLRASKSPKPAKPVETAEEKKQPEPEPVAAPEPEPVKEEPKEEPKKEEPVAPAEPVVAEEPKKPEPEPEPEAPKEEPKKEEKPAAEPVKRKLNIVRRKAEPEPEPQPEPQPQPEPEQKPEPVPEPQPQPEPEKVEPAPEAQPEKRNRKNKSRKEKKAEPEPPKEEKKPEPEPVKEEKKPEPEAPKEPVLSGFYLMPVDKEAFLSLYPNCAMGQVLHLQHMPFKYMQAMKEYLIPLGPTGPQFPTN